ncbi:MAG: TPM domain-containing protein [Ferruginibacter sp.]
MHQLKKIWLCLFLLTGLLAQAQQIPPSPQPPRLVTDYTNTLTGDQRDALEDKLVLFDDSTSTQVAVVIVNTTGDRAIEDYALELFRSWGIGNKKTNNGVLLLITRNDHKLNITTGYGLEGALPDITCKHIIDEVIVPRFKGDDYYAGIDEGTDAIMQATRGEYTAPEGYAVSRHEYPLWQRILFWIVGIIVLFILIKTGLIWPILRIATSIVFSGGGSSSGGSSFGGFGGGSSGGGGASGSW